MADYLENKILDHAFRIAAYDLTGVGIYVGLSTTTPTDAGGNITEPSGANGYARQELVDSTGTPNNMGAAASGQIQNDAQIEFGPNTTSNWGSITHFFLADDLTAGNVLWWGSLGTARTVNVGDYLRFAVGALTFTLD